MNPKQPGRDCTLYGAWFDTCGTSFQNVAETIWTNCCWLNNLKNPTSHERVPNRISRFVRSFSGKFQLPYLKTCWKIEPFYFPRKVVLSAGLPGSAFVWRSHVRASVSISKDETGSYVGLVQDQVLFHNWWCQSHPFGPLWAIPNGCQAATCSYYDWTKFCKNHTNIIWTSKNGSCTVSVLVCILPDSLWICWNMLECCEDKCIIMHPNLLFSFRCIKTCLVRLSLHNCLELSFERNKVGTCPEDLTTKRKQRIQDIWLRLQKRFSANVVLSCQPLQ